MAEKKMWGGRFRQKTAALVEEYTESVSYDKNLYKQDIAGSKAHARMLARQQVISQEDADSIVSGLDAILKEIEEGKFQWKTEYEDVHMNIESRLSELIGDAGKRLHTGRSRNDQVALDFRLYVSDSIREWQDLIKGVVAELVKQAEEHVDTLLPGCTHMQPAQPVSLAHHLLAYAWMLTRDFDRLVDCDKRARVCPLGAAALAGTTYPLDPASVAEELGMYGTFKNSMDAVSDRDFVLESMFAGSLVMTHLSRLNEELVYWANPNFGYIFLPDAYATGSSIMPQKKNPDVSEIMRGKVGRTYGALMNLLTTVKGLPMTYNRDMQEDKEPFIDTDKTVSASLAIMAGMLSELRFNTKRMEEVLKQGFLNATELADYLVGKGVPFREAHHITGAAVALAEDKNKGLEDLSIEEFRTVSDLITEDVYEVLSYKNAVARRKTQGGTGPDAVRAQIAELNDWLS
ncbi:argininosuccinate lyase [Halodesulfovibrio marinisediminis]|uniref:Argininosuccinate lyase n=1 Tax=Halodesulfovibrio marinisediminis DSM 17456 TaxID=1121457 RepID=A0A1N6I6Q7_9BACT|nr:argininosuccinate lyase [Halodesulfovibrio marinisediminis]SIO27728.1 argininosuccinate lyase [Halodesulfovibrio marinisediminis DSM 17456]